MHSLVLNQQDNHHGASSCIAGGPNEIIGRTYLYMPEEDNTRTRLHMVEAIGNLKRSLNQDNHLIRALRVIIEAMNKYKNQSNP